MIARDRSLLGFGIGAGLYIQHPNTGISEIILPINGITNNYYAELIGLFHALQTIQKDYPNHQHPIIILSDCKPAVEALRALCHAKKYKSLISKCLDIINHLPNIPIIYWIPREYNEKADRLAKRASVLSRQHQIYNQEIPHNIQLVTNGNETVITPDIDEILTHQWSREWTMSNKTFTNSILLRPNKIYFSILCALHPFNRRLIGRILSGHVRLKYYMHKYQLSSTSSCPHCRQDETIQHVLLYCNQYNSIRATLFENINRIYFSFDQTILIPNEHDQSQDAQSKQYHIMRTLLTGNEHSNMKQRLDQVKATCNFLQATKRNF